jgi:hypothetical protein
MLRILRRTQLAYYRYEVTFGLYVMLPAEKAILNTFVLGFFGLLLAAVSFYLPDLLSRLVGKSLYLYTGSKAPLVVEYFPSGSKINSSSGAANSTFIWDTWYACYPDGSCSNED